MLTPAHTYVAHAMLALPVTAVEPLFQALCDASALNPDSDMEEEAGAQLFFDEAEVRVSFCVCVLRLCFVRVRVRACCICWARCCRC